MSSSQSGPAHESISIVENILANHLLSKPAHEGSTKLINAFKSHLNNNTPVVNYHLLKHPFTKEGRKLEECILDPAYHNVIAHLMSKIGLNPAVIPLWAQTSSSTPSLPASHPQTAPSVLVKTPSRRVSKSSASGSSAPKVSKKTRTASPVDEQELWRQKVSREINEKVASLQDRFVVISEAHYDLENQHRSVCQQLQQRGRELLDVQRSHTQLEHEDRQAKEERDQLETENNNHRRTAIAAEEALVEMEKKALRAMSSRSLELELLTVESETKAVRLEEVEKEFGEERRLRRVAEERTKSLEEELEKLKSSTARRVDASNQTIVVPPPLPPPPPQQYPAPPPPRPVSFSLTPTSKPKATSTSRASSSETPQAPVARSNPLLPSSTLGQKRPLSSIATDDHQNPTTSHAVTTSEEPLIKKPTVKTSYLPSPPSKQSSLGQTTSNKASASSTPKSTARNPPRPIPSIHEVGPRFGKGQPEDSEEKDAFQAFWASKIFPSDLHQESKICLACHNLNPSASEPLLFPSPVLAKRLITLKMNHLHNEHPKAYREITRGR
ncbi:hypothetical protein BDY24DRAFT_440782 [Mrakia frigida]|uniref:uncharacterized protein n=1 Tax=Mrakia frigida TaxID=29902 RepID=UPI003FCC180F